MGLNNISGAINRYLPIFTYWPSGNLKDLHLIIIYFSCTVVSRESLLSTLMSPETKQNFYFISRTVSKSDELLKAYPRMWRSLDKLLVM